MLSDHIIKEKDIKRMKDIVQDKKRSRIHATKVPKSSEITRFHAKKKKGEKSNLKILSERNP